MAEEAQQGHRDHRVRARREGRSRSTSTGAYYLGPDKGGEKAYKLLAEAMRQTGRSRAGQVGGARQAVPGAAAARSTSGLVMQVAALRGRGAAVLRGPGGRRRGARTPELKLAVQLIEQIATDEFQPENYEDEVAQAVPRGHPAQGRGPGGHAPRPRQPRGADHRPHGSAEGQPGRRRDGRTAARPPRPREEQAAGTEGRRPEARARVANRPKASRRLTVPRGPPRRRPRHPRARRARRRRLRALSAPARVVPRGGAQVKVQALPGPGVLGPARARLGRSARAPADRGPGPRRPRRQPHRPHLHRRPLRRLPLRRRSTAPASRTSRPPSPAATASSCATATSPPSRAARRPPTSPLPEEIGALPRVPGARVGAARGCAPCSSSGRIAQDGLLAMLRDDRAALPPREALRVRPRRRATTSATALRLFGSLPPVAAEHLHRQAHRRGLRRGARAREAPARLRGASGRRVGVRSWILTSRFKT